MGKALLAHESSGDLVQSVCREVLERIADERLEYRSTAEFKQWLYNAAIFKIRNRVKYWAAARRNPAVEPAPGDVSRWQLLLASLRSPSQEAILGEGLARLEAALASLPKEQQRIIVMARLDGRSHKEIAAEFGITESHSRVLLARGLARLARVLDRGTG